MRVPPSPPSLSPILSLQGPVAQREPRSLNTQLANRAPYDFSVAFLPFGFGGPFLGDGGGFVAER